MKKFEEEKKKYLNELTKHYESIEHLQDSKKYKKLLKLLQNPKDEDELRYAKKYLMYLEDDAKLIENINNKNVEEFNLDNFILIDIASTLIKLVHSNDTEKNDIAIEKMFKIIEKDINLSAELKYQIEVLLVKGLDNFDTIIKDKFNLDSNKELEFLRFHSILYIIIEKFEKSIDNFKTTEKGMKNFIKFADRFHEVCINEMKQNSNLTDDENLENDMISNNQKIK